MSKTESEKRAARLRLGEQVAALRLRENMSQEALAQALGVTRVTVARWERGIGAIGGDSIANIEELFDVRAALLPATVAEHAIAEAWPEIDEDGTDSG